MCIRLKNKGRGVRGGNRERGRRSKGGTEAGAEIIMWKHEFNLLQNNYIFENTDICFIESSLMALLVCL